MHNQSTQRNSKLLAGIAEMIVTPPQGAPLLGTIQRHNGVHDDLYARALVLNDGRQAVALVFLDLIGLDFTLADEIRDAVRERNGITTTLLNCSHTHSAPFTIPWSVLGWRWLSGPGRRWRDELVPGIAELVFSANATARPGLLGVGRAPVQIGSNRRLPVGQAIVMKPNPDGAVVPWVDVLRVDRLDEGPAAILFSHAAHPVIIHGASRLVSADYPGFASRKLRERLGGNVMAMFGQACGANINAEPLRGGFLAAERAGSVLAEAAFQAACDTQPLPQLEFSIRSVRTDLPLQPLPSYQECSQALQDAEKRLARCCGGTTFSDEQLWEMQDRLGSAQSQKESSAADDVQPMEGQAWWLMDTVWCLRDLINKIEQGDERPLRFDAHLLRIGDHWSLLAVTHELFAEYQLRLDKAIPTEHNMMLAYTNGCESYIPMDRDLSLGGYEAASFPSLDGAALRYRHRRALRPGAEQLVIEQVSKLWA